MAEGMRGAQLQPQTGMGYSPGGQQGAVNARQGNPYNMLHRVY
jgi:hypothetical protein